MLIFCTFLGLFDPRATGASQDLQGPYLRHWWLHHQLRKNRVF